MADPLLVIGLDGFDIKKAKKWTPELLLDSHNELDLAEFDRISTYEIWPTMYTGKQPHEIHATDHSLQHKVATNWNHLLRTVGSSLNAVIPDAVRTLVSENLSGTQSRSPQRGGKEIFSDESIFDGLKARIIDVPGWNFRTSLDIQFNEVSLWEVILENDGVERCYDILDEEIDVKIDLSTTAVKYPYDIVWVHIHALDSIQHLFDQDVQREWYERIADDIDPLLNNPDTAGTVILSDHGLEGGDHREPGLVAVSDELRGPLPDTPKEVHNWLHTVVASDAEDNQERMNHLAELGYRNVPEL